MSTAERTTSKLAKNWPSKVFRGVRPQIQEVQIPLYFQGLSCWWAQLDLNQRPDDYESPALTAELWARTARNPRRPLPSLSNREVKTTTIAVSTCPAHKVWPIR